MKVILFIAAILCCIISCKEKTTYQMSILIRNNTDSTLTVSVFPKEKFMISGLHDVYDIGGGGVETVFEIDPNNEKDLFISKDLEKEPYVLASEVFDSIHIELFIEDTIKIKFSPDTVIGYSSNLYDSTAYWDFKVNKFSLKTNFTSSPYVSYDYYFDINEDNILFDK